MTVACFVRSAPVQLATPFSLVLLQPIHVLSCMRETPAFATTALPALIVTLKFGAAKAKLTPVAPVAAPSPTATSVPLLKRRSGY